MNELLSQLWTPQIQVASVITVLCLLVLYVCCIIWVVRDAYQRGANWHIWAVVALVPVLGVVAYLLLRPQLLELDRQEQELEVALKQRELMKYGECAKCGYPVEADFILCPNCHQQLKNLCGRCHHALDPSWTVCPYCGTPTGVEPPRRPAGPPRRRRPQQQSAQQPQRSQTASTTPPREAAASEAE